MSWLLYNLDLGGVTIIDLLSSFDLPTCYLSGYVFIMVVPYILQEEVSIDTTTFIVQFTPTLTNSRTPNPAWDGNMTLSPLNSVPVLSIIGNTSTMVCTKQ